MSSERSGDASGSMRFADQVPARDLSRARARVVIVSDVRLYREGLLESLARQEAFDILGTADLSGAAVARVVGLQPEAIILDIGGSDSLALAKSLGISLPTVKIVAFAVSEVDYVVLACAEAGIAGYVGPDGSEKDLVAAIECALRGELYCSPRVAGLLLRRVAALSAQPLRSTEEPSLTQREQQILGLVGEGMSNKQIGRALRIGESTVKNHIHSILKKLQVHRRGEAAARLRIAQLASRAGTLRHRRQAVSVSSVPEPMVFQLVE
jgi:two-component system, NarL family, nitrate/nitrite response regulator NarL